MPARHRNGAARNEQRSLRARLEVGRASGTSAMRLAWHFALLVLSCGSDPVLRMSSGDWHSYVRHRNGGPPSLSFESVRFRAGLCDADELRPEYGRLDETSLTRFLERQHIEA